MAENDPVADISEPTKPDEMTAQKEGERNAQGGIGCAWTLLGVNIVLIGLLMTSMVQGPYASDEQELWYRYGSLACFLAGAVVPAVALFALRRSRTLIIGSTAWMLMVLLAFVGFGMMSSGGV
jgi:hypothetical protein